MVYLHYRLRNFGYSRREIGIIHKGDERMEKYLMIGNILIFRLMVYGIISALFFYFGIWLVYLGGTDQDGTLWFSGYGFYGMGQFGRVIVFGVGIFLRFLWSMLFYFGGFTIAGVVGYLTWFGCFTLLGETLVRRNVSKIIKIGIILAILSGSIIGAGYSSRWFGYGVEERMQLGSGGTYVYRPTDPFMAVDTFYTVSSINGNEYVVRESNQSTNFTFNKDDSNEQLQFKLFVKSNLNVGDQVGLLGTIPVNITSISINTLACEGFYIKTEQCICEFRDSTGWGSYIAYARSSGLLLMETTGSEELILKNIIETINQSK
jgi:hypothetical protein